MEFDHKVPIYIQVIRDIKIAIIKGQIGLGEKLPSGRDLALQYKINPNTSSRIYKELEQEGISFTKRGLGTFVTEDQQKLIEIREELSEGLFDNFIFGMKEIGYQKDEVIEMLNKKYK